MDHEELLAEFVKLARAFVDSNMEWRQGNLERFTEMFKALLREADKGDRV